MISCKEKPLSGSLQNSINLKNLISIDFSKREYRDLKMYAKDTVTDDGWKINYLVKNDRTKNNDLYIRWSKGKYSNVFLMQDVLLMRRYFIPILEKDNLDFIYMTHGCATSCIGVLVLSKSPSPTAKDFLEVIEYNTQFNKIVYTPKRSYSLDTFEIAVSDLKKGIEKSVIFKNKCNLSPENGCIDKINFSEKYVDIFAALEDTVTGEKVKESNRIKLTE